MSAATSITTAELAAAKPEPLTPQMQADALERGFAWSSWEAVREHDWAGDEPVIDPALRDLPQFETGYQLGHDLIENGAGRRGGLDETRRILRAWSREASRYPESTALRADRERNEASAQSRTAAGLSLCDRELTRLTAPSARIAWAAAQLGLRVIDHDEDQSGPWPVPGYAAILDLMSGQLMLAPWLTEEELRAEITAFGVTTGLAAAEGIRVVGPGGFTAPAGWLAITPVRVPEPAAGPGRMARDLLDRAAGGDQQCDHSVTFEMVVPPVGEGRLIEPLPETVS